MNEKRPDELAVRRVLEEIKQGRIRIYRNVLNEPWVYCEHSNHPAGHWRLLAKDFRSWFAFFIWEECRIVLRDREIERVLVLLSGLSLQTHVANATDPAMLDLIEQEPVIAVLIEFMDGRQRYESSMESLWKILGKFAKERGLSKRGTRRFPGGPHVLSRMLRRFHDVLNHLGIEVQVRRSNGCKVTLVGRMDASKAEPSAQASDANSPGDNALDDVDDREQRLAALENRQREQSNSETESEN